MRYIILWNLKRSGKNGLYMFFSMSLRYWSIAFMNWSLHGGGKICGKQCRGLRLWRCSTVRFCWDCIPHTAKLWQIGRRYRKLKASLSETAMIMWAAAAICITRTMWAKTHKISKLQILRQFLWFPTILMRMSSALRKIRTAIMKSTSRFPMTMEMRCWVVRWQSVWKTKATTVILLPSGQRKRYIFR